MFQFKQSFKTGLSFGLTSGVITTLGLMVGLSSGTHSQIVVIGGIIFIAIADSLSDALGIHISEESREKYSSKEVWESTFSTFLSKFIITLTFLVPILLFPLTLAVMVSVVWGLFLIGLFSFNVARKKGEKPYLVIAEHIIIAILVITLTHYVGDWIANLN